MDTNKQERIQHPYRGRRPRFPSLMDFCDLLRKHEFFFKNSVTGPEMRLEDLEKMKEVIDRELQLYQIAWSGGDDYMKTLASYVTSQKNTLVSRTSEEKLALELYQFLDQDLKNYQQRLNYHDWYHSFSDDGNVMRNGAAREEVLYKIAKAKGGLYEQLWNHYSDERTNNIRNSGKSKEN